MKLITKKKDYVRLKIPPYRMDVFVSFIEDPIPKLPFSGDFIEELENDGGYQGICYQLEDTRGTDICYLRLLKKYKDTIVMHECIHAAEFILSSRGITISPDNHEALTYLTEFLFHLIKVGVYNKKGDPYYD